MAQPPPRDGPRLRALDQRSLLKVSMKSRREQMKDNRDKAYASRGKKKLRGMLRAAAHQVKYTHDDRSELVRLLEEGQDPASIVGPLGAFRELPPRVASASDLLRSYGVDQTAKPLHRSQSLRQYDLGADDAATLGSAAARARAAAAAAHYVTPTDRIARLYTPTAATLTMRDATAVSRAMMGRHGGPQLAPARERERAALTGLPESLRPTWATHSLGAKARDDALTRVARVAPAAYHAAARTAAGGFGESMSLDESSDGDARSGVDDAPGAPQVSIVDEAPRDAEPAPKPAPATPTSPSKRRQLARERRGAGAARSSVSPSAAPATTATSFDAELWNPGARLPGGERDDASLSSVADAPREAARYQEAVENYWARVRALVHRGAAHAAGAGKRRALAQLPDAWLGGIAGRVAPPKALLRERAKVLRARQTVRAREGGPDGDRVGELALEKSIDHFLEGHLDDGVEDQNDHWSFSAVERAERVADEALEESRLGFADGVARAMVDYEMRDANLVGLLDIDPAHLRAAPRWWTSVEHGTYEWRVLRKTGVARRRVHRAFYAAATRLRVVERVMYELHEAWLLPRQPAAFGAAAAPAAAPPAITQGGEAAKDDDDDAEGDDDGEALGSGRRLSARHAPKLRRDSQAASGIITAAAMAETASHHHETSRPPFSTVLLTDAPSTGFRRRLPLTLDVFCTHVERHAGAVRDSLKEDWLAVSALLLGAHLQRPRESAFKDASRFLEGLGAAPPFGVSSDVPASLAAAARHHLIAPEDADAFQEAGDGDSAADEFDAGQDERATFPTSKAPFSAVFHSFRLISGRAIISRNGLEA